MTALLGGGAYVNVHTAKNPAGEIRGQVTKGGKGAFAADDHNHDGHNHDDHDLRSLS